MSCRSMIICVLLVILCDFLRTVEVDCSRQRARVNLKDSNYYYLDFLSDLKGFLDVEDSDSDENKLILTKIANMQAMISIIGGAVHSKYKELAGLMPNEDFQGLVAPELFWTRAWLRAKVTILRATERLWKESYILIKRYRNIPGMNELVRKINNRPEADSVSMDMELSILEILLPIYEPNRSQMELWSVYDPVIDTIFGCDYCTQTLASLALSGAAPLARQDKILHWVDRYVDKDYLDIVQDSERIVDKRTFEPSEEEIKAISLDDVANMKADL